MPSLRWCVPALGGASRRTWTVGGLLETLGDWFLARSDEARRLQDDHASERLRLNRELISLREASKRQVVAYERALYDRDRYRHERDGLYSARSAPVPEAGASERVRAAPAVRDPYAGYGTDVPPAADSAPEDPTSRRRVPNARLAVPSLKYMANEVPQYPGYCTPAYYGSGPAGAGDGTSR